ncbi:hypothetical protein A3A56_03570 [Candidatus Roizmanbacteria bacterium RIFCSPLOWO2_01_FULL_40_32]|nr:MAG: hypothetical protein A3A56_03570 [Candidatus Roizmanbacteria bacterium RIFCSPLOWO2_01_FULL_40_32]
MEPEMKKSPFWNTNTFLLIALIALVVLIIFEAYSFFVKSGKISILPKQPAASVVYPTLTQAPVPSAPPPANLEFYRTVRNSQSVPPEKIITSEYKGKLTGLTVNNYRIEFSIDNGEGFVNDLSYDSIVPIDKSGLEVKDVKIGDNVIVTETTDVTKEYPKGIISIKIMTYEVPN